MSIVLKTRLRRNMSRRYLISHYLLAFDLTTVFSRCSHVWKRQQVSSGSLASLPTDNRPRFILANTEQLHAKIIQMSDRIRHLEDALEIVQAKCSSDPHPLLHQDSLRIKNSLELYSSHATAGRHVQMDGVVKETHTSNFRLPVASSSTRHADKVQDRRSEVICFTPSSQAVD
jgi:hypothetical protein